MSWAILFMRSIDMEEKRFLIEVSEKQLLILKTMADEMSRLICGQLEEAVMMHAERAWERDHKTPEHPLGVGANDWYAMRDELKHHLEAIRKLCWNKSGGAAYGIRYNGNADILIDIYEVLRKAHYDYILTDGQRELMSFSNMADKPMHYGKEPLAKVSVVTEKK